MPPASKTKKQQAQDQEDKKDNADDETAEGEDTGDETPEQRREQAFRDMIARRRGKSASK